MQELPGRAEAEAAQLAGGHAGGAEFPAARAQDVVGHEIDI